MPAVWIRRIGYTLLVVLSAFAIVICGFLYLGSGMDTSRYLASASTVRLAFDVLEPRCLDDALQPGMMNEALGLDAPEAYFSGGEFAYGKELSVQVLDNDRVELRILYGRRPPEPDDPYLRLDGVCTADGMQWEIGESDLPQRALDRFAEELPYQVKFARELAASRPATRHTGASDRTRSRDMRTPPPRDPTTTPAEQVTAPARTLPASRDTVARGLRFAEQAVRPGIVKYFLEHDAMPTSNEAAGLPAPDAMHDELVSRVEIGALDSTAIVVTFAAPGGSDLPDDAAGRRVVLVPVPGRRMVWDDTASGRRRSTGLVPDSVTFMCQTEDMPVEHLPSHCNQQPRSVSLAADQATRDRAFARDEDLVARTLHALRERRTRTTSDPPRRRPDALASLSTPFEFRVIDGNVSGAVGVPRIMLEGRSAPYSCAGYSVEATLTHEDRTVTVTLLGVAKLGALCLTAVEPATLGLPLDVGTGSYELRLKHGVSVDRYRLDVTAGHVVLGVIEAGFSQALAARTARFPENSFAFLCRSSHAEREECLSLADRLAARPDIDPLKLGADEVPPGWSESSGIHAQPVMRRYFRYASDAALDGALELLARVLVDNGPGNAGFSPGIHTWKNEVLNASTVAAARRH